MWYKQFQYWCDNTEKILNDILFGINSVNSQRMLYGGSHYIVIFEFEQKLSRLVKIYLDTHLNKKLLPKYLSVLEGISTNHITNLNIVPFISYRFNKIIVNSVDILYYDSIEFNIKENSYTAVGISQDAQFLPKLGLKKKINNNS